MTHIIRWAGGGEVGGLKKGSALRQLFVSVVGMVSGLAWGYGESKLSKEQYAREKGAGVGE